VDSEIEDILSHIKVTDENKSLQKEVKKVLPGSIKAVIE